MKRRRVIIELALLVLAGLLALVSLRREPCFLAHTVRMALPFVMIFFGVRVLYSRYPKTTCETVVSMIELTGMIEAMIGGWQWIRRLWTGMGVVAGTFANSGPYGGFLALTFAVAFCHIIRYRRAGILSRVRFGIALTAGITSLIMLSVSLSRAGWIAAGVAAGAYLMQSIRSKGKGKTALLYLIPAVALVLVTLSLLLLKRESALGRFHIWEMETRVMLAHPLGVGIGNELGAYGDMQASFFSAAPRSPLRVRIAGCPEYAFNEYLKMGMQGGIACCFLAILLAVLTVVQLNRRAPELGCGMMALAVFAAASYPLDSGIFQASLAVFLAVASAGTGGREVPDRVLLAISVVVVICTGGYRLKVREAEKMLRSHRYSKMGLSYQGMSGELAPYYPLLSHDYRYLYEYGYALHKESGFAESNRILSEGAAISSDPMFHNVMGLNYQRMQEFDKAEAEFLRARDMVPDRIIPVYFLMLLYREHGRERDAREMARKIAAAPVNPKNETMVQIKERVLGMEKNRVNP